MRIYLFDCIFDIGEFVHPELWDDKGVIGSGVMASLGVMARETSGRSIKKVELTGKARES